MTARRAGVAVLVAGLAVQVRLLMTLFDPQDFDFTSYQIVADIRLDGGNVYAETTRYNYGPVWFLVLDAGARLARATGTGAEGLRIVLVLVLSAADLGIGWVLWKRYGHRAALVFLFAPIGLIISGQHHQFDNLAVCIGLVAAVVFGTRTAGRISGGELAGLVLLGLSLSTKHVLLLLPVWLMVKQRGVLRRLVVAVVPFAVLVASFLPWIGGGGWEGIQHNVIAYRSFANAPLLGSLFGEEINDTAWPMLLFAAALGVAGLAVRRRGPLDSALVYLVVVVAFSPAITNQYLAIPLAAVAVAWNAGFAAWMAVSTAFLVGDPRALGVAEVRRALPDQLTERVGNAAYHPLLWLLLLGCALWLARHRPFPASWSGWVRTEARFHLAAMRTMWGRAV